MYGKHLTRLPIKWKLTLWSAIILLAVFILYSAVQFVVVDNWMLSREKQAIRLSMVDTVNYFLERETSFSEDELGATRQYLMRINQKNQLIRIIDDQGNTVIAVSNGLDEQQFLPKPAKTTEWQIERSGQALIMMRNPLTIYQFSGTIEIIRSTDEFEQLIDEIFGMMVLFALATVIISALGGGLLAWQLLKPLKSMAETIRRVESSGLSERMIPSGNGDELSQLMTMFNEMMDKVELAFRRKRQFVEDASHELRTPIAILQGHLRLLERWGKDDPVQLAESLRVAREELDRLGKLVEELLQLSDQENEQPLPLHAHSEESHVDLFTAVSHIIGALRPIHPTYSFQVDLQQDEGCRAFISPAHFEQVMLIVLDNAIKYSGASRQIVISGSMLADDRYELTVTDFGIGIPANDLPFVTDRFYRVDRARSRSMGGNGLGLSIALRILERSGAVLSLSSVEDEGTSVVMRFLLAGSAAQLSFIAEDA